MRLIDADALRDYAFEVYQGSGVELETLMVVPLGEIDNAPTYNQVGHRMATAEGFITNPEWNKSDLISRDALKEELELSKYIIPTDISRLLNSEINRCIEAIDNAPAVAAISTELHEKIRDKLIRSNLRPQGEWIRYRDNPHQPEHIKCSNCGQYWSVADHDKTFDFCFKCGAYMRKRDKHETDN